MRVVIATGDLGAGTGPVAATGRVAAGWAEQAPHDQIRAFPMSDGGEGFLEVIADHLSLSPTPTVVTGPAGTSVPAAMVIHPDAGTGDEPALTAYLQAGQAAGRHLLDTDALADPAELSSAGVGELLAAARAAGASRVVLGVGDLACHDGGAGLLRALGAGDDLADLAQVRHDWAGIDLVLALAGDLPLLGFHGASAALSSEHGVSAVVSQRLEARMGEWTEQVARVLPHRTDLLTGQPIRPERQAGAGMGGGVGYAALLLGARPVPGARWCLEHVGAASALPGALVVTGAPVYDWRSIHQGVVAEVGSAAAAVASPVVVMAGEVSVGRREGMSLGVSATYAVGAGESLQAWAARVARTWSPPPRA